MYHADLAYRDYLCYAINRNSDLDALPFEVVSRFYAKYDYLTSLAFETTEVVEDIRF